MVTHGAAYVDVTGVPVGGDNIVARATALMAIGERALAEQMLRHQAKIGSPADQSELIAAARALDLGGAQFWLAHNGQPGTRVAPADRYPAPRWQPDNGWRIDPALAYAHVIQDNPALWDKVVRDAMEAATPNSINDALKRIVEAAERQLAGG